MALLFVPLLAVLGHRRAAAVAVLSALGFAGVSLAMLHFDLACWLRWWTGTLAYATQADVFAPPELGYPPFTWMNQCLRCAVARVVGEVPAPLAAEVPCFVPGLGCEPWGAVAVRSVASALLLLVTAAVVWRRRKDAAARLPAIAVTFALSFLLSPISWKAHHVALLPCFALLFAHLLLGAHPGRRRLWIAAGLYALACVLGEEITGKAAKELLQSSYVVTLGTLGFWLWTLRVAGRGG